MKNITAFVAAIFCLMLLLPLSVRADLPLPAVMDVKHDDFFDGAKNILIWVHSSGDSHHLAEQLMLQTEVPALDLGNIYKSVRDNLNRSLIEGVKNKVSIKSVKSDGIDPFKMTDEGTVVLEFTVQYRKSKIENKNVVVGTVFPTLFRLPPDQMRSTKRVSGYHWRTTTLQNPQTFIFSEASKDSKEIVDSAISESLSETLQWINRYLIAQ